MNAPLRSSPVAPAIVILDGPNWKGVIVRNSDPQVQANRAAFIAARRAEEAAAPKRPAYDLSADLARYAAAVDEARAAMPNATAAEIHLAIAERARKAVAL